jgi:hypothetical protein
MPMLIVESSRTSPKPYLDDIFMIQVRGLLLESSTSRHLETEESTHRFLWCVSLLLALKLLLWNGVSRGGSSCSLALLWSSLSWLRVDGLLYRKWLMSLLVEKSLSFSHKRL